MSLPKYWEYKKSGFGWAAELPVHWGIASLKWLCDRYSGGTPDKNKLEFWENGTIPWLNSGAVNDGRIYEASAYITQEAFENSSAKWIPPGALVMALAGQGKTKGMVAQLMFASTCNQSMAAIVPTERIEARCLYWWLVCNYQNIRNMAGGDLRDGLNLELLGAIPCPLPPLAEQTAIAAFLDRETAKIDVLIAEQEKLIALLAEKRLAAISHAVTKGLKPNTAMKKDTGVAWLGEVPAHWEVTQLKRLCDRITDGAHISPETEGGTYSFVSTKDLDGDSINFEKCLLTSPSSFDYLQRTGCRPAVGDVLFSKDGTIGRTVVVRDGREFVVASSLIIITPSADMLDSDFLNYLCKSSVVSGQVEGFIKGAGLPRLSIQNLLKVVGLFPSMEEQRAISAHLKVETQKFDVLSAAAERAVALLKERRSALIAATVTGQIDVRGIVVEDGVTLEAIAA
jgi:type I restriction enzyme S subunit